MPIETLPTEEQVSPELASIASHANRPKKNDATTSRRLRLIGINVGIFVAVAIVAAVIIYALQPNWEDQHKDAIRAKLADASKASHDKNLRGAYDAYNEAVAMVGDHPIDSPLLLSEVNGARDERDKLYPLVQAQLAREEASKVAAARAAEAARIAAEKAKAEADRLAVARKAERERAAVAEKARLVEEVRQQKLIAAAQQAEQNKRARVRLSPEYQQIVQQAHSIRRTASLSLNNEDSAYRAIATSAEANCTLIELLARQRALLMDRNVSQRLKLVDQLHTIELTGEDSAIRAIYKHDQAMLQALGVLISVWIDDSQTAATLSRQFADIESAARRTVDGDDSAPRAIVAFNDAQMRCWAALAQSRGIKIGNLVADTDRANMADDSTWRIADRDATTQCEIALLLLRQTDPQAAALIQRSMTTRDATEDSAIRALAAKKNSISDALEQIISQ